MALPGASKLNEEKVMEIKNLFKTTTLRDGKIAEMYGVSREHINKIRLGKRWNAYTRSYVSRKEMDMMRPNYIVPMLMSMERTEKNFYDVLCDGINHLWKKITSK